jgi:Dullard-like phosphatase family protein
MSLKDTKDASEGNSEYDEKGTPSKKILLNWWEDPEYELEVPLEQENTSVNIDESSFEDMYERWRERWNEEKIDRDINNLFVISSYLHKLESKEEDNKKMKPKITSKPLLPRKSSMKKLTLVLDLDHTLVFWSPSVPSKYDSYVKSFENEVEKCYYVSFRPYLIEFLDGLKNYYELILFTAGSKDYGKAILKTFDPENKYFDYYLFRDSWQQVGKIYFKILDDLGRPLTNTIIVDNNIFSFMYNIDNGIPILDYFGDENDKELKYLLKKLEKVHSYVSELPNKNFDMRKIIRRKYKLKRKLRERYHELSLHE